jgi:hypothetical protein
MRSDKSRFRSLIFGSRPSTVGVRRLRRLRWFAPVVLTVLTCGCASGVKYMYTGEDMGPLAKVTDSMFNEQSSQADFCVLLAIDGEGIDNAISDTYMRTQGHGFRLQPYVSYRMVSAKPMQATLRCDTYYAAPISELVHKEFPVEGVVAFTPVEDASYVVKGVMGADGSEVWIEDEATGQAVTEKVAAKRK